MAGWCGEDRHELRCYKNDSRDQRGRQLSSVFIARHVDDAGVRCPATALGKNNPARGGYHIAAERRYPGGADPAGPDSRSMAQRQGRRVTDLYRTWNDGVEIWKNT